MNREQWVEARRRLRIERKKMNSIAEILSVLCKYCESIDDVKKLNESLCKPCWRCVTSDRITRRTLPMHWAANASDHVRISYTNSSGAWVNWIAHAVKARETQ